MQTCPAVSERIKSVTLYWENSSGRDLPGWLRNVAANQSCFAVTAAVCLPAISSTHRFLRPFSAGRQCLLVPSLPQRVKIRRHGIARPVGNARRSTGHSTAAERRAPMGGSAIDGLIFADFRRSESRLASPCRRLSLRQGGCSEVSRWTDWTRAAAVCVFEDESINNVHRSAGLFRIIEYYRSVWLAIKAGTTWRCYRRLCRRRRRYCCCMYRFGRREMHPASIELDWQCLSVGGLRLKGCLVRIRTVPSGRNDVRIWRPATWLSEIS